LAWRNEISIAALAPQQKAYHLHFLVEKALPVIRKTIGER
jgi:hypothetical protein